MSVREARAADIISVLDLLEQAQSRSVYAGRVNVDRAFAQKSLMRAVHTNGHTNHGASCFLVATRDGKIEGYFLGVLDRVYQFGDRLCATDVHFFLTERAEATDAIRMVTWFLQWADDNPNVEDVAMGQTAFFKKANDDRFEKLLRRAGFAPVGSIYRRAATQ